MSLEATMIVLDNSAHSLNGDFIRAPLLSLVLPDLPRRHLDLRADPHAPPPAANRLQAQSDCIFTIMGTKINAHPENEVGLMVMAGKGCVLLPLSSPCELCQRAPLPLSTRASRATSPKRVRPSFERLDDDDEALA